MCIMLPGDDNAELGDQSFQYITTDNMKSTHDDSLVHSAASAASLSLSLSHLNLTARLHD